MILFYCYLIWYSRSSWRWGGCGCCVWWRNGGCCFHLIAWWKIRLKRLGRGDTWLKFNYHYRLVKREYFQLIVMKLCRFKMIKFVLWVDSFNVFFFVLVKERTFEVHTWFLTQFRALKLKVTVLLTLSSWSADKTFVIALSINSSPIGLTY